MNLLLVYAGVREQELAPLLDIFNELDIPVKLCQFADQMESDIIHFSNDFSHFLFVPSQQQSGHEGVIAYLCGHFQAAGERVCILRKAGTVFAPFLEHLKIVNSLDELKEYFILTKKKWKKLQQIEQAIQQLNNQGISFSEDGFFNIVKDGSTRAVELFLKAGMPYYLRDRRGVSVLSYAVRNHHLAVVELLLANGADVNTVAEDRGNSVLMDACSEGVTDICKCLLESGADVNMKNKNNQTALILAVGGKSAEISRLLIRYGADPEHRDNLGMSAREYAKLFGIGDMLK